MFSFTKKIIIAVCMVVFYSGQFYAFGSSSDSELDYVDAEHPMITPVTKPSERQVQQLEARVQVWQRELKDVGGKKRHQRSRKDHLTNLIAEMQDDLKRISKRQRTSINDLPTELLQKIILSVDNANPRDLGRVCKFWRSFFYTNESIEKEEDVRYSGMTPLGQKLMRIRWYRSIDPNGSYDEVDDEALKTFLNGVLQYRPTPESDEGMVTLKISDLPNPFDGTFDLSKCGGAAKHLVITTNISEFFAPHPDQEVIGFFPHFRAERIVASTPGHPFKDIMGNWDKNLAPVGIFWRWGRWPNTWFDYLTRSTIADISALNLYDNCAEADGTAPLGRTMRAHGPHTAPLQLYWPSTTSLQKNFMFVFELK